MLYILGLALVFLIIVFIFTFTVLIPSGKEYRIARMQMKKTSYRVDLIQDEYDKVYEKLKNLKADNRHMLSAYKMIFNPERFIKKHSKYFESFSLSSLSEQSKEGEFAVYEVNTTSLIQSPKGFYDFIDAVNKSDSIISINFPIHFQRDANLIKSSFTMRVYVADQKTGKENKGSGTSE